MADEKVKPGSRSLTVLPDPKTVNRILAKAEAHQQRSAMPADSPQPAPAPAPVPVPAPAAALTPQQEVIQQKVIAALQKVYDPEIPVNIWELGLVYGVDVKEDGAVVVRMTLTAPACPVAESLPPEIEQKLESIPEVKSAYVDLVWDPPWGPERMSEAAKLQLGML